MSNVSNIGIAEIGHNDSITQGGKTYHVQTEVSSRATLKIRTTIFQGGTLLDAIQSEVQSSAHNQIYKISELAKNQHENTVRKVLDGKYT